VIIDTLLEKKYFKGKSHIGRTAVILYSNILFNPEKQKLPEKIITYGDSNINSQTFNLYNYLDCLCEPLKKHADCKSNQSNMMRYCLDNLFQTISDKSLEVVNDAKKKGTKYPTISDKSIETLFTQKSIALIDFSRVNNKVKTYNLNEQLIQLVQVLGGSLGNYYVSETADLALFLRYYSGLDSSVKPRIFNYENNYKRIRSIKVSAPQYYFLELEHQKGYNYTDIMTEALENLIQLWRNSVMKETT
jgi:hypothetical protein